MPALSKMIWQACSEAFTLCWERERERESKEQPETQICYRNSNVTRHRLIHNQTYINLLLVLNFAPLLNSSIWWEIKILFPGASVTTYLHLEQIIVEECSFFESSLPHFNRCWEQFVTHSCVYVPLQAVQYPNGLLGVGTCYYDSEHNRPTVSVK